MRKLRIHTHRRRDVQRRHGRHRALPVPVPVAAEVVAEGGEDLFLGAERDARVAGCGRGRGVVVVVIVIVDAEF